MAWALWLAIPVVVTLMAAVVSWLRGRPKRALKTDESMRAHGDFLDALAQTARSRDHSRDQGPPAGRGD